MSILNTSGWSGFRDDPPPRLTWPDARLFTSDECARLIALRHRVQRGLCDERGPEIRRWAFVRWACRRGLFDG